MSMNYNKKYSAVAVIFILVGTVLAFGFEINSMYNARRVTLADLLLMFIYIEVIGMIGAFWGSKSIRITYPLLIAITALSRLIILQDKDSASINLIYQGSAILLLALSVFFLKLRYSKKLGMDKRNLGRSLIDNETTYCNSSLLHVWISCFWTFFMKQIFPQFVL